LYFEIYFYTLYNAQPNIISEIIQFPLTLLKKLFSFGIVCLFRSPTYTVRKIIKFDLRRDTFSSSVVLEPHHFDAALALGKNVCEAPASAPGKNLETSPAAPAPTLLCS
jgi:hypothetical protein